MYNEAKYCLKKVLLSKPKTLSFKFIILIIKLYFIPWQVLKLLRKV